MSKTLYRTLAIAVLGGAVMSAAPEQASAIPAFSQQTGQSCQACHFAIMPRLNAEGRRFRINAFRDSGTQALMEEDDSLSLPVNLNASLRLRTRLSFGRIKDQDGTTLTTGGVTELDGSIGRPSKSPGVQGVERADLFIAGRIGRHLGAITDVGVMKNQHTVAGEVSKNNVGISQLKLAYVWDTNWGPIALAGGSSRTNGASYIFNDPSNAVSSNLRGWQHGFVALDAGGEGVMSGQIGGFGVYAHLGELVYLAAGGISQALGAQSGAVGLYLSPYARMAFTFPLGSFDIVAGGWYSQLRPGKYNAAATGSADNTTQHYGMDLEMQGTVGDTNFGFYLPWQFRAEQPSKAVGAADDTWYGIYPVITASSGPFGVRLGYDYSRTRYSEQPKTGASFQTWMVGIWFAATRNIVSDLEFINTDVTNAQGIQNDTLTQNAFTLRIEFLY